MAIYLINLSPDGVNAISAKCRDENAAYELIARLSEVDIELYRVGYFCYWLQKHNFYRLAYSLAPLSNP